MTKYIISSGASVVSELLEMEQSTAVKVTNEADKALSFNTRSDAKCFESEQNFRHTWLSCHARGSLTKIN